MDWPGETWLAHKVSPGSSCPQLLLKTHLLTLYLLPLWLSFEMGRILSRLPLLFPTHCLGTGHCHDSWHLPGPRKHLSVEFSGKCFLDTYIQCLLDLSHKYLRSLMLCTTSPLLHFYLWELTESKSETSSVCLLFLQWLFAASIMLGADLVPGDTGVNNKSPAFLELTCHSERGTVNSYEMKEWNERVLITIIFHWPISYSDLTRAALQAEVKGESRKDCQHWGRTKQNHDHLPSRCCYLEVCILPWMNSGE